MSSTHFSILAGKPPCKTPFLMSKKDCKLLKGPLLLQFEVETRGSSLFGLISMVLSCLLILIAN